MNHDLTVSNISGNYTNND